MKEGILILCIVMFIGQSGCQHGIRNSSSEPDRSIDSSRTEFGWEKIAFKEIEERLSGSGVEPLQNHPAERGVLEVRFWVGLDTLPLRSVILKKANGGSKAFFLAPSFDPSRRDWAVRELHQPENGWDTLWSRLDQLHLFDLRDASELGMEHRYIDMTNVVVEIRRGENYRTYHLFGLGVAEEQKHEEVRNIKDICTMLSDEFDLALHCGV